ncbi:MAG: flavin reductase family protein [Rhizobiaceae bacterium]|nr:flavin reductase family protein [Rhizobiaceae bacterium]
MFFEPPKGHGLPHDPFKALVAPRPIGWISTVLADGALNLSPYSYFNAFSTNPHLVWFSSDAGKDSETFARETGEFVVNIVGRAFFEAMVASSVDAPRGVNEFDLAGMATEPSRLVAPPRVKGIPAALECKVTEVFDPRGLDGRSAGATVVAGEVVGIFIDDAMLTGGRYDIVRAGNVARLGYHDYTSVDAVFSKSRPRWSGD